jgi:hypothetical protein
MSTPKLARLEIFELANPAAAAIIAGAEFERIANRPPNDVLDLLKPYSNCIKIVLDGGAKVVVAQRYVLDSDFLAEFTAYYSRQFADIGRHCTRLHFFSAPKDGRDVLAFLDAKEARDSYLGFVTLRPVSRTPIGATILSQKLAGDFVKSSDTFPVHIGGVELELTGTPFMQQDNAVGACAQASIWMALRTMRKREGDRAHDPAQITDAATRFMIGGRKLPNREGLHQFQMTEAIRAAGYSPHVMTFSDPPQIEERISKIHPYIESEIPVITILDLGNDLAHAVVVVGHGWNAAPSGHITALIDIGGSTIALPLACSWSENFIIHNDNTGPYRRLSRTAVDGYSLKQIVTAIPLLPSDVFMTAEEAREVCLGEVKSVLEGLGSTDAAQKASAKIVLRLLLVEKWRLRKWAAANNLPQLLAATLRNMLLPRRVWIMEVHDRDTYGLHAQQKQNSVMGLIVLDPTSDFTPNAALLQYWNISALEGSNTPSVLLQYGAKATATKVEDKNLLPAFRE